MTISETFPLNRTFTNQYEGGGVTEKFSARPSRMTENHELLRIFIFNRLGISFLVE